MLAPDSPEVHQALGEYYLLCLRDFSNATTQLERVLALVPGSGDANLYLGLVERRQGHWRRAVELFRRARDLDPRNPETGRVLVTTLTWGSRYAEAQTVRAEMIAAQMASLQDRFEYVETSVLLGGHPQDVEAWFAGLSQAERGSEDGTELKREWALNSGDWRRFLTLPHPTDTDPAYFNMEAMVLVALGEPSQAQELLKKRLPIIEADAARNPGDPATWMELAVTRAVLGKGAEAVAASDHAIAILPETLDKVNGMPAGEWRIIALAWSGHKEAAIRELGVRLRTPCDIRAEYLTTGVAWFPLRDDPAFQSLVKDPANYQPRF